jgi:hypothetical protein
MADVVKSSEVFCVNWVDGVNAVEEQFILFNFFRKF